MLSRPPALRAAAVLIVSAAALPSAYAVEPFVLKDIRIEGLQRTDPGTVFAALPFRIGDTYTDDKGAAALRALFATGLFKDVRIEIDGQARGGRRRGAFDHRGGQLRRPEGVRQGRRCSSR